MRRDELKDRLVRDASTDNKDDINQNLTLWNVHVPRTLDESYYVGLNAKELDRRNKSQVISKLANCTKEKKPLLAVSQVWLWRMDNFVIAALRDAAYGPAGKDERLEPLDCLQSDLSDGCIHLDEDMSSRRLIALIMSEFINYLDRPHCAGFEEPIFFTFEKAITRTFADVQAYIRKKETKDQLDQEKQFLLNINDIRDELAMIKTVIEQQEEVWNMFYEDLAKEVEMGDQQTEEEKGKKQAKEVWEHDVISTVKRPKQQIPMFKLKIERLDNDAQRVKEAILDLINLKGAHASLKESQNSTRLNVAVICFTIVTIIFTPLSFLSSLLALPIDHFQHPNVNGTNVYPSRFVANWIGKFNLT
jgi:hypothetical protein